MNSQSYLCAMCNKHFNFFIELTSHIKTNHENVYLEYFTFQLERDGAAATSTTPTTPAKEKAKNTENEKSASPAPTLKSASPKPNKLATSPASNSDLKKDLSLFGNEA